MMDVLTMTPKQITMQATGVDDGIGQHTAILVSTIIHYEGALHHDIADGYLHCSHIAMQTITAQKSQ